jgi:hypothetical protein
MCAMHGSHIIAEFRTRAGLSQQQLAARIGVNQSTISHYERGGSMDARKLSTLAEALGLGPDDLKRLVDQLGAEAPPTDSLPPETAQSQETAA